MEPDPRTGSVPDPATVTSVDDASEHPDPHPTAAATPARARQTEAALLGQTWNEDTVMAATAALRAEFQPISDMRASAAYRQTVLGNLLRRFWLESQGEQAINLESLKTLEALS